MRQVADNAATSRWPSRSAYTLLELLIASVLVAALMAAAWGLMSMYGDFLLAGRSQATEQQLARSLIDLMTSDLRSVTTRPLPIPRTRPAAMTANPSDPLRTTLPFAPTKGDLHDDSGGRAWDVVDSGQIDVQLPEVALRGSSQELTLLATRAALRIDAIDATQRAEAESPLMAEALNDQAELPSENGMFTPGLPARPRAAEWTQVFYRFVPPEPVMMDVGELTPGLHRFEIPVEYLGLISQAGAIGLDDSTDPLGALGDDALDISAIFHLLSEQGVTDIHHEAIPEVVSCRWEFLDGLQWLSSWDSGAEGRMPSAVRLRFKLLSADEQSELLAALGVSTGGDEDVVEPEAIDVDPVDETGADPYQAFSPRLFERIVLLDAVRRPPQEELLERFADAPSLTSLGNTPGGAP